MYSIISIPRNTNHHSHRCSTHNIWWRCQRCSKTERCLFKGKIVSALQFWIRMKNVCFVHYVKNVKWLKKRGKSYSVLLFQLKSHCGWACYIFSICNKFELLFVSLSVISLRKCNRIWMVFSSDDAIPNFVFMGFLSWLLGIYWIEFLIGYEILLWFGIPTVDWTH